jgi:hypothetical protein
VVEVDQMLAAAVLVDSAPEPLWQLLLELITPLRLALEALELPLFRVKALPGLILYSAPLHLLAVVAAAKTNQT